MEQAPLSSSYSPPHPLDLAQTLRPLSRGTADPTMQWDASGVWRTLPTPLGAATLHLASQRGIVTATAWGDGAEWAIAAVPELLGSGDDYADFDVSQNAFLHDSQRRNPGLRLLRTGLVLEMMVAAIFEQKVTGKEARRAWATLVRANGEPAPGPAPSGMRVFPSARAWRLIPSWEWHAAGVDPHRSRTAIAAASVAGGLERTLLLGRGGAEVAKKLRSVPGVGIWTAAETTQRGFGKRRRLSPARGRRLGTHRQPGGRRRDARTARPLDRAPATRDATDRGERLRETTVRAADDDPGSPTPLALSRAPHLSNLPRLAAPQRPAPRPP